MDPDVPSNAPEACPGTSSQNAGKSNSCAGCPNQSICASGNVGKVNEAVIEKIKNRLSKVKNIIIVMSGKGGVGKSSVTASLAWSLSGLQRSRRVGVLDIDITGPSIPIMMGCEGEGVHQSGSGWSPVFIEDNLEVMSVGLLLGDPDQAVIWRGPRKNKLLESMMSDVDWSELDYLLVDTPPGTTDEHISLVQLLREAGVMGRTRAVMVTTGQEVSISDVRRQVGFCGKVSLPVAGVIENMKSHRCSECGFCVEVFPSEDGEKEGGVAKLCRQFQLRLLAQLPLDSRLTRLLDTGVSIMTTDEDDCIGDETMDAIEEMVANVIKAVSSIEKS